jgi:hypothetical protein
VIAGRTACFLRGLSYPAPVCWALLHGFALVAVLDDVIVNSGFGFLDADREPGVFRLELLMALSCLDGAR